MMTFLNPQGFFGLILALPIIAVYLLRLQYTNVVVPSLSLWQSVLHDRYANRPWQKLRKHWLLLLQLLILTAVVFALAQPVFPSPIPIQERVFILLDISASMLAQTGTGQNRFELAVEELQKTLSTFQNRGSYTLITVAEHPDVVMRSVGVEQIRDELDAIIPVHMEADWASATQLARSLVGESGSGNVMSIIVSDFASETLLSSSPAGDAFFPGDVYTINVGDSTANAGLVHMSVRYSEPGVTAFIRIQNSGPAGERTVDILADDVLYDRRKMTLPSDSDVTMTLYDIPAQTFVEVRLQEEDAFPLDDRAWAVLDSGRRNPVLLVTSGNRFLAQALTNLHGLDFYQASNLSPSENENAGFAVLVVDKSPLPILPNVNMWLLAPDAESICGIPGQEFVQPSRVNGRWQHPLLEYVDWSEVHIQRFRTYDLPDPAEVLLYSREGPLLWIVERGGYRSVCTSFQLQDSDLPLRLAFPILTSNVMAWLSPHLTTEPQVPLTPGALWRPVLPANTTSAVLIDPDQMQHDVALDGSSVILDEVGLYRLFSASQTLQETSYVAVSLLNPQESDLRLRGAFDAGVKSASVETMWGQYDLSRWLILFVFILCCVEAYLWWGRGIRIHKTSVLSIRFRPGTFFAVFLRLMMLVCVLGAFFGMRLRRKVHDLGIVFVVDQSASTRENWEKQQALVKAVLESKTPQDQVGVVLFGRQAWVDRPLSADERYTAFASVPARDATDIERAIRLAAALIPDDLAGRIVLLSDGLETKGQGEKAIVEALTQDVDVMLVNTGVDTPFSEVWIDQVDVPNLILPGDLVPVRVALATNQPQVVRINWSAGTQVGYAYVDLNETESFYQFSIQAGSPGFVPLRVCLESEEDFYLENNCADNWLVVQGTPQVLVVAPGQEGDNLIAAIQAGGMSVIKVTPGRMPQTLEELAVYSAVILVNTPARDIPRQSLANLAPYISDVGGGFIAIGGPQSYGVGGWLGTQLEEVLPVEMRVQDPQRFPPMVMSLIIDTSGSMSAEEQGVVKIKIAAEAAFRATESLNAGDTLLVVGYSDGPDHTIGPIEVNGDMQEAQQQLYRMGASGGGIFIYESLAYVNHLMSQIPIQPNGQRHILLLADGGDAEHQQGVLGQVAQAAASGISTSSISIGRGRDVPFLQGVAEAGQGRFYLTDNAGDLPAIFTEEVARVKRSYIVEDVITPIHAADSETWTDAALPTLKGYVATARKGTSEVVLTAGEEDPILALWQYGLGRSAAWTSDATDRWASNWLAWDEFARFWNKVLRDVLMQDMDRNISMQFEGADDETRVVVDVTGQEENELDLYLRFSAGSQDEEDIIAELEQVAPGRYQAVIAELQADSYLVRLYGDRNFVLGWAPPPVQEYMPAGPDSAMNRFAAQSEAYLIEDYEAIVKRDVTGSKQAQLLIIPLLLISAVLWVSNVVWRRLSLSWKGLWGGVLRQYRRFEIARQTVKQTVSGEETSISDALERSDTRSISRRSQDTVGGTIKTSGVKSVQERVIGEGDEKAEDVVSVDEKVNIAARLRKGLRDRKEDK